MTLREWLERAPFALHEEAGDRCRVDAMLIAAARPASRAEGAAHHRGPHHRGQVWLLLSPRRNSET